MAEVLVLADHTGDAIKKVTFELVTLARQFGEPSVVWAGPGADAAKDQLVREGYDPSYGARPLKRSIQRGVLDPLAMRVLEGDFREGDTVVVDAGGDALTFTKQEPVRA